ncbi:MAG: hypothetical protein AB3K77_01480 [Methanosarcinaceae archaeon]
MSLATARGGIITFTSIVTNAVIPYDTISMTTSSGLPEYGLMPMIGLIFLLSFRQILSVSKIWEKTLETSVNAGIYPLLYSLFATVVFKTLQIM